MFPFDNVIMSKIDIIDSDDVLSSVLYQTIIWPNALLLTGPVGTKFGDICIKVAIFIQENEFENVIYKMVVTLSWFQYIFFLRDYNAISFFV